MKQFYFKSFFLSLLMVVTGWGNALAAETWVQTDPSDLKTDDIVMIIDRNSDRAMSNDKGTSNPPVAHRVYYTDNDETESTGITGKTVPGYLQWVVTVSKDNDNVSFKFGVSGTSKYLYCTNTNNGVRVGTNSNNAFTMVDNGSGKKYLKNTATSRYLGVYNSQDWRCYENTTGNIAGTVIAFYKKVESSATLTKINISGTYPTTFNVGDEFSHEGMKVTATYSDNTTKDVSSAATFTGYDMSTAGEQTVTVSYENGEETKTATYTITVNVLAGDDYTLVENVTDLRANDKVIIVNTDAEKAMGQQRDNNRAATDIRIDDGGKAFVPSNSDVQVFTLEGDANGWYFKTDEGYIYAASSGSNYLKTESEADENDNAKASITFSNGDAIVKFQGTNTRNLLRYNSNNGNPIFSCYGSATAQNSPIQLYKKVTTTTNQYTLVAGTEEYPFEGLTLTKELPAQTEFYIKDSTGKEYHSTDAQTKLTIIAENHENLPTSEEGENFYLSKANTWVFTLAEGEGGAVTLTVSPQTAGETKYMLASDYHQVSNDVFDANNQLTKEMTTEGFYITRTDDYGITNLTAAESNVSDYYIWEFSDDAETVGYIPGKIINVYRVSKAGSYTFTLDLENKTLTAELVSENQYTLVAGTEEYPFEGLTLTKALPEHTQFYIKDGNGNVFHSTDTQTQLIINAENHENLPTSAEGNDFYLSKANTWVFTLTEGEGGAVTLTVNPEAPGATQYMLSETYLTASDAIFDASYKLTKDMTTDEFYIVRSDDYGLTNLTPANFNAPEDRRYWIFSEDAPTVEFITGEIRGSYTVAEAGLYNITLDLTNNTVTAEATSTVTAKGNLNNSGTGVFAGVEGFTTGTNSASGTLKTGVGNVTVNYAGTTNSYLNDKHIKTYSNGTTLKFTAPDGYELRGIDITFSSGDPRNLTTNPNDTYTSNTESKLGSWTGRAKTVTFTGKGDTSQLTTAEVTLMKAPLSPKLDRIDVEGYTTDFVVGDPYIFDGTATVTYEDGSTKVVTSEVEVYGPNMSTAGDKSANISYTENGLSVVAVITIHVREPQDITFRKITSTDELVAGKRYVIVDEKHNVAMGACSAPTSSTSYFTKFDATISDEDESVILKEGKANANILTLGGEEGAWTFATSIETNKYLAYTGSSNSLESGANAAEASAQWTITFDEDGNARILNNKESGRYIRYNSSQPRFACYGSTENHPYGSQNAVQLFVESDLEDVTLTISAAGYATLYYSDRALKVPEGVTAKTYKVVDGKLAESKTYASGSKIPKGEAVVLKGAPGEYTFKVTSTAEPKDADNQLKGSDVKEPTTGGTYYYALQAKSKDGKHGPGFYWMNSTGDPFENGAHKAYMALDEKFAEAQAVGGAKEFYLFDEATTGISGIDAAPADRTEMYNLNGQRVDRGYKGVVIKNGKKILRK